VKLLLVSIDSLNRHFLDCYEPSVDRDVETPNLDRFAERATVFERHYAGSLPCMPARREWLAGVQEFLWRPWGPAEPFDALLPERLRAEGTVTQLVTDHYHYFQHGSGGYVEPFNGFEFVRGHEFDAWKTVPREPERDVADRIRSPPADDPDGIGYLNPVQYARNVDGFAAVEDYFAPKVFSKTASWLEASADWDDWFCYVDSFDVHEPFDVPEPYASMYTDEDPRDPSLNSWPEYGRTDEGDAALTDRELSFVRSQFAAKLTMADDWFGRVLDALDAGELWDETAVVVTSDHGFYLGEHGYVGKPFEAPLYDVLAHTPLFVWHPDASPDRDRVSALTSAVDVYATVLDAFGLETPDRSHSRSLLPLLTGERSSVRERALYGYWGSSVNVTDGRYTYLHPCRADADSYCYSSGAMNPHRPLHPPEPRPDAEPASLPYADAPVWRYPAASYARHDEPLLFDTAADPWQECDLAGEGDPAEARLRGLLVDGLDELAAPDWQYERLGFDGDVA